jgi:signal transduction histidine kinase
MLANDLRNLLAVMVSCLDSIRSNIFPGPDSEQMLAELDGAIDGAFYISREMLGIARPHRVDPAVVDVNELVAQARGVLERILGDKIRLSFDLAAATPVVRADVVELEWVLLNLAANAADAMPDGGVFRIETALIDRRPAEGSGTGGRRHYVRITASDSGPGMDDDVRDHALEPFFTTKDGRKGLGLTSAAVAVRRLGGWLHIESNPPKGARIAIYVPTLSSPRNPH